MSSSLTSSLLSVFIDSLPEEHKNLLAPFNSAVTIRSTNSLSNKSFIVFDPQNGISYPLYFKYQHTPLNSISTNLVPIVHISRFLRPNLNEAWENKTIPFQCRFLDQTQILQELDKPLLVVVSLGKLNNTKLNSSLTHDQLKRKVLECLDNRPIRQGQKFIWTIFDHNKTGQTTEHIFYAQITKIENQMIHSPTMTIKHNLETFLFDMDHTNIHMTFQTAFENNVQIQSPSKELLHLFDDSMTFKEWGIGGLQDQLKEIMRRAFVSRMYRPETIKKLGYQHVKGIIMDGMPGTGKCLSKGTPVLLWDGRVVPVETIQVGDLLVGDDSTPRKVLSLAHGFEQMYQIEPLGKAICYQDNIWPYTVNSSHILTVGNFNQGYTFSKRGHSYVTEWDEPSLSFKEKDFNSLSAARQHARTVDKLIDLSLNNYFFQSKQKRDEFYGVQLPVQWPNQNTSMNPFLFGFWMGKQFPDQLTQEDCPQLSDTMYFTESSNNTKSSKTESSKTESSKTESKKTNRRIKQDKLLSDNINNTINNKLTFEMIHTNGIPMEYKRNSVNTLQQILAGIIDASGTVTKDRDNLYVTIIMNQLTWAQDLYFIAKSLGCNVWIDEENQTNNSKNDQTNNSKNDQINDRMVFKVTLRGYSDVMFRYSTKHSKTLFQAPERPDHIYPINEYKFDIKNMGQGEYFGFTLDGNGRFLLGDFTVTHNTLIARRIGEILNVKNPKVVNGPELMSKWVGTSEENMRNLFIEAQNAKENDESLHLIIFDEIDAICKTRGTSGDSGVGDRLVNQLLTMMDGVKGLNNILVIGMTNRIDLIDPALLRPGRFEVHISIGLPNEKERFEILQVHTKKMNDNKLFDPSIDLMGLARHCVNFTGAELAGLVRSAQSFAMMEIIQSRDLIKGKLNHDEDEKLYVEQRHFDLSLKDIKPAFGLAYENWKRYQRGGVVNYAEWANPQPLLDWCNQRLLSPQRTMLISGEHGTGCTALASYLAQHGNFDCVKFLSPHKLIQIGSNEAMKNKTLRDAFEAALYCERCLIVIDDLEDWIELVPTMGFSKNIFSLLKSLIRQAPPPGKYMTIIATTHRPDFFTQSEWDEMFIERHELKLIQCDRMDQVKKVYKQDFDCNDIYFPVSIRKLINRFGLIEP